MKDLDEFTRKYHLKDTKQDILSHPHRTNSIHILTVDMTLATDIYERIHNDPRMKNYKLIRLSKADIRENILEMDRIAKETVRSRVLIFDVRRSTLPKLQGVYNKIVGYNRRDFNKLCFTILVGDGPVNLFQAGKSLDIFVPHLTTHRIDYHPAVFFYDPFLHYEPGEIQLQQMHEEFEFPSKIPRRLVPYFKHDQNIKVEVIRRFFRATGKTKEIKKKRLKSLRRLYKKRIAEQFPHHKDQLKAWLSKKGIKLTTENLHLYPLFFEEWIHDLMQKAQQK